MNFGIENVSSHKPSFIEPPAKEPKANGLNMDIIKMKNALKNQADRKNDNGSIQLPPSNYSDQK